jgi:hypothetical protein
MNKKIIIILTLICLFIIAIVVCIYIKNTENYDPICNSNGNFNKISKECECKTQEMLVKKDNQLYDLFPSVDDWKKNQLDNNFVKRDIPLYTGMYCEKPVQLTELTLNNENLAPILGCDKTKDCTFTTDSSNDNAFKHDKFLMYKNDIPLDFTYQNIVLLKICPFHDGLQIKNIKINNGDILFLKDWVPLGENTGYKDTNDCKIIYQGYSGWPVSNAFSLVLPYVPSTITHIGGIDCDFTLTGHYNNSEKEWSVDLNVKRDGFDLLSFIEEGKLPSFDLNLKVIYKETGIPYDNYYVKNGTFDVATILNPLYGSVNLPVAVDLAVPSMVVIGEPMDHTLTKFQEAALQAGYEISSEGQIFSFLLNTYVIPCTQGVSPVYQTGKPPGFWDGFVSSPYDLGSAYTYILPWLSSKDSQICTNNSPGFFNFSNFVFTCANTSYYYNSKWTDSEIVTFKDHSKFPPQILNWIDKMHGMIIYSPQLDSCEKFTFNIGTQTELPITIPADSAKRIAQQKYGSCNVVYVIPWKGVKFVDVTIRHGNNYGNEIPDYDQGIYAVFSRSQPMKTYINYDSKTTNIDPKYTFYTDNPFSGLDVDISVVEDGVNGSPSLEYLINISKPYCATSAAEITVYGTKNVLIEQPTIGLLASELYSGVVIIGQRTNSVPLSININKSLPFLSGIKTNISITQKDERYDYFVKQPDYGEDGETSMNYPGFIFITPKYDIEEICKVDSSCNNGKCVGYQCVCNDGWYGKRCEYKKCLNDCSGNGMCDNGKCVCYIGFGGEDCSKPDCAGFQKALTDCRNSSANGCPSLNILKQRCSDNNCGLSCCVNNCSGNGTCNNGVCVCSNGYTGTDCSTPPNCTNLNLGIKLCHEQQGRGFPGGNCISVTNDCKNAKCSVCSGN